MRALGSLMEEKMPRRGSMRALCSLMGGAACVHYLAGKESINISGKCHSGLARQEISKSTHAAGAACVEKPHH